MSSEHPAGRWTLLTNHGAVLLFVARNPDARIREIASAVSLTERATTRISSDLRNEGYLASERFGRRNHYSVDFGAPLRHPAAEGGAVGDLLGSLVGS